jgi:membrane-associated phospholipid phosphatase
MTRTLPLKRVHRHALVTVLAFALIWAPVLIFAAIADSVRERVSLPFDAPIQAFAYALHSVGLTNIFLFITTLGQPLVVGGVGLVVLALLLVKWYYRNAALVAAGLGGAVFANQLLKLILARARPTQYVSVLTENSYSFPSGHAMVSAAFAATMVIMVWQTRFRIPALIFGSIASLLIGLSRIYLGVHYPSDVLAGWALGLLWAVIAGSLIRNRPFGLGKRLKLTRGLGAS